MGFCETMQARVVIVGEQVDNDVLHRGIANQPSPAYSSLYLSNFLSFHTLKELEGNSSETDSIKFKISSKTPRGKKDSTKRHHHRHHKRQPGQQQFPKQVVTG